MSRFDCSSNIESGIKRKKGIQITNTGESEIHLFKQKEKRKEKKKLALVISNIDTSKNLPKSAYLYIPTPVVPDHWQLRAIFLFPETSPRDIRSLRWHFRLRDIEN